MKKMKVSRISIYGPPCNVVGVYAHFVLIMPMIFQASLDALPVSFGRGEARAHPRLESETELEESLIDFTQSPPPNIKVPKIRILHPSQPYLNNMSSEVTLSQNDLKSESRPQSTTDSAIGGSTSPDESSSASKANDPNADSSFSADEREEENFESYGENEDSNLDFEA